MQEQGEDDSKYVARQQAAVDEINKRGLVLFHATVQVHPQPLPPPSFVPRLFCTALWRFPQIGKSCRSALDLNFAFLTEGPKQYS